MDSDRSVAVIAADFCEMVLMKFMFQPLAVPDADGKFCAVT